jgi:hypothetical protein
MFILADNSRKDTEITALANTKITAECADGETIDNAIDTLVAAGDNAIKGIAENTKIYDTAAPTSWTEIDLYNGGSGPCPDQKCLVSLYVMNNDVSQVTIKFRSASRTNDVTTGINIDPGEGAEITMIADAPDGSSNCSIEIEANGTEDIDIFLTGYIPLN